MHEGGAIGVDADEQASLVMRQEALLSIWERGLEAPVISGL